MLTKELQFMPIPSPTKPLSRDREERKEKKKKKLQEIYWAYTFTLLE